MSLCLRRQEYNFFWGGMCWVGVGSEMLCVSGQVVLVLVLVLGIWGKVRRGWRGWLGENVSKEGEGR